MGALESGQHLFTFGLAQCTVESGIFELFTLHGNLDNVEKTGKLGKDDGFAAFVPVLMEQLDELVNLGRGTEIVDGPPDINLVLFAVALVFATAALVQLFRINRTLPAKGAVAFFTLVVFFLKKKKKIKSVKKNCDSGRFAYLKVVHHARPANHVSTWQEHHGIGRLIANGTLVWELALVGFALLQQLLQNIGGVIGVFVRLDQVLERDHAAAFLLDLLLGGRLLAQDQVWMACDLAEAHQELKNACVIAQGFAGRAEMVELDLGVRIQAIVDVLFGGREAEVSNIDRLFR